MRLHLGVLRQADMEVTFDDSHFKAREGYFFTKEICKLLTKEL